MNTKSLTFLLLLLLPHFTATAQTRKIAAPDSVAALESQSGIPLGGFPKWEERVIHEWINRARSDPQFEMALCGASKCREASCYRAMPPLAWSDALARAARFHADEMQLQHYFAHDSKCAVLPTIPSVYPLGCDGSAACACTGGVADCGTAGCTHWYDRVGLFGVYATGEIIASPSDPNTAFYMWLYEGTSSSACQFSSSNGHRWNILTSDSAAGSGTSEYNAVVDFGWVDGATPPRKIASAAHYPRGGDGVEIWANWYDTAAPKSANAVVDGSCLTMSMQRGTATNGAWTARPANVGEGCHFYFLSFTDASGATITYPESGSYVIGASSCGDWTPSRHRASCSAPPSRKRPVRR